MGINSIFNFFKIPDDDYDYEDEKYEYEEEPVKKRKAYSFAGLCTDRSDHCCRNHFVRALYERGQFRASGGSYSGGDRDASI